jgi:hypothetical protein
MSEIIEAANLKIPEAFVILRIVLGGKDSGCDRESCEQRKALTIND